MNPLLRAVIESDFVQLKNQAFVDQWCDVPDRFGFTPLEIARYLGKDEVVELLRGKSDKVFKLQPHGGKHPVELSLDGFEKALNFRYRSFLTFPSYHFFMQVLKQCPYILRNRSIASENYEWMETYRQEVLEGKTARIYIKWINPEIGYGAFAAEEILKGQFVGEYTGIVRRLYRSHPDHNPYCFHYPTKWWSLKYFIVDSMREGNLTRFINHSDHPNLQPLCLVDRRLLHQVFVANRTIKQGEQLTFDYGEDYWNKRNSKL
jgi:uncharacterized protein